jgi:4-amino-4-deoxy-L-arabinose transferase-like glycosyltransferase
MSNERDQPIPFLLAPLLVLSAALRIAVNNVVTYSRADETVYLLYAKAGYPQIVRMFLDDPGMWVLPNPLRWAWIGTASIACSVSGECTHRTLASISTVAGIIVVGLTWVVARELFGTRVGLIATALAATSPLQLALGRRALADEFFCAAVLLSIATLLSYLRTRHPGWLAAWIAATTIAIAAKEQFLFIYPVLLLFWWLRSRRAGFTELAAWAAPPLLFFAMYCVLARDVPSFFSIVRIITSSMTAPYAEQYQSGPPHRMLLDLMAVAPIVTIVAMAALVTCALRNSSSELRHIALLAAGMFAVHALLPSQNLRYIAPVDPLLRIIAAAFVAGALFAGERRAPKWLAAILLINAASELALFHRIFVVAQVYDPVTDNLLRALKMLPR